MFIVDFVTDVLSSKVTSKVFVSDVTWLCHVACREVSLPPCSPAAFLFDVYH